MSSINTTNYNNIKFIVGQNSSFSKVSKEQFDNDCAKICVGENYSEINMDTYADIIIPTRATKGSAGYDFHMLYDLELKPNVYYTIPTGIRAKFIRGVFLAIVPKSGLGFKYGMRLANTIGIIDSDYYNSDNEGHIMVKFSVDRPLTLHKGDKFCQGIFILYGVTFDDDADGIRNGGFGSTGN